jgi:hypothetical protein
VWAARIALDIYTAVYRADASLFHRRPLVSAGARYPLANGELLMEQKEVGQNE